MRSIQFPFINSSWCVLVVRVCSAGNYTCYVIIANIFSLFVCIIKNQVNKTRGENSMAVHENTFRFWCTIHVLKFHNSDLCCCERKNLWKNVRKNVHFIADSNEHDLPFIFTKYYVLLFRSNELYEKWLFTLRNVSILNETNNIRIPECDIESKYLYELTGHNNKHAIWLKNMVLYGSSAFNYRYFV